MSRIAVICARGGSKGVPNKNVRSLAGKPLIAWTVEHALTSELFDAVAVSSDSSAILEAADEAGADVLVERPAELANDTVSVLPAIRHCLEFVERKGMVLGSSFVYLQATSPTRLPEDIRAATELWERYRPGSVVTGRRSSSSPYFSLVERNSDGCVRLSKSLEGDVVRRQDAPRCFDLNGSIYVFDRDRFLSDPKVLYPDSRLLEMSEARSVDIDTELDWQLAEVVLTMALHRSGAKREPQS